MRVKLPKAGCGEFHSKSGYIDLPIVDQFLGHPLSFPENIPFEIIDLFGILFFDISAELPDLSPVG